MPKKKTSHPHGHYCKICGEYKANEKFSGKGHANHICKTCSKLSAAEKAEAQTITQLMNFNIGRLSTSEKRWLENRVHDHRPEVAALAREVYNMHFPYAERNARKKRLLINTLVFELSETTVFDEYGDEYPVSMVFTADRLTGVLTMNDFNADGVVQSVTLEKKEMTKLLRWVIHTLEIFIWEEDYHLGPDELDFDDWEEEYEESDDTLVEANIQKSEEPKPEAEIRWRVHLEYADTEEQDIVSYEDYLYDKPDELFWVNPKFCVNSIWGANRAKIIQGGSRGIRLLPC